MAFLSESDREDLTKNPNVLKVTQSNVTYTPKFKIQAVRKSLKGVAPSQIFADAEINTSLFGKDYAKGCLKKWRKIYEELGEEGLKTERRGSGSTGRPKKIKFSSAEEELRYLRVENDFLKKLHALAEKYQNKKGSR